MTTSALSIIRVSGDGQDESSQRGSCKRAADREGLNITREIQLHAVSGFKGAPRHLAAMADALNAVRTGEVQAIVVAHSSRAARLPHRDVIRWQWDVEEAGGRLVSDDETGWARGATAMDDAWSLMTAGENHKKSEDISAHVNRTFRQMDAEGMFRGQPPAGYETAGDKRNMRLVPAPARRDVTRHRKDRAASAGAGERVSYPVTVTLPSAQDVKDAFADAHKVSTVKLGQRLSMTPDAVAKMLRNRVYSTGQYEVKRADGVTTVHACEALVKVAVQDRAIAALERRRTGDNVTSRALAKDDLSGALWCGQCAQGVMYRYYSGKDGARIARYKCSSCCKSVKAQAADAAVHALMSARNIVWLEPVWIEGSDHQDELDRVGLLLSELPKRGLSDDDEDAERARLRAERKRLEALPREAAHWAGRYTGYTEGGRWNRMATSERRAWLNSGEFRIYAAPAPGRTGNVDVNFEYVKVPQQRFDNLPPLPEGTVPSAVIEV
jgi:DNA invertase Pin-like site-specific DNA recombinase